jgi:hypothetical protein
VQQRFGGVGDAVTDDELQDGHDPGPDVTVPDHQR